MELQATEGPRAIHDKRIAGGRAVVTGAGSFSSLHSVRMTGFFVASACENREGQNTVAGLACDWAFGPPGVLKKGERHDALNLEQVSAASRVGRLATVMAALRAEGRLGIRPSRMRFPRAELCAGRAAKARCASRARFHPGTYNTDRPTQVPPSPRASGDTHCGRPTRGKRRARRRRGTSAIPNARGRRGMQRCSR